MVRNETLPIFAQQSDIPMNNSAEICINSDSITVRQSSGSAESTLYENGFHLIFVTNGTVEFSSAAGTAIAASDSLILLTPSMSARITRKDNGSRTTVVHIVPNYFDSLPDGQLMYQQFSQYMGRNSLPVFRLSPENARNMYRTIALFNEQLNRFRFYRIGTLRHICSLLLLQIAETLHSYEEETTVCLRHSDEIFRKFKQMAHEHYSSHHDIAFYANRLNISTTYLSRIVKRTSGRTVHAHISELLMAEAKTPARKHRHGHQSHRRPARLLRPVDLREILQPLPRHIPPQIPPQKIKIPPQRWYKRNKVVHLPPFIPLFGWYICSQVVYLISLQMAARPE